MLFRTARVRVAVELQYPRAGECLYETGSLQEHRAELVARSRFHVDARGENGSGRVLLGRYGKQGFEPQPPPYMSAGLYSLI